MVWFNFIQLQKLIYAKQFNDVQFDDDSDYNDVDDDDQVQGELRELHGGPQRQVDNDDGELCELRGGPQRQLHNDDDGELGELHGGPQRQSTKENDVLGELHGGPQQVICVQCSVQIDVYAINDEEGSYLRSLQKSCQDGLSIEYRCPRCRSCTDCRNSFETERVSIREEAEDLMVRDSV